MIGDCLVCVHLSVTQMYTHAQTTSAQTHQMYTTSMHMHAHTHTHTHIHTHTHTMHAHTYRFIQTHYGHAISQGNLKGGTLTHCNGCTLIITHFFQTLAVYNYLACTTFAYCPWRQVMHSPHGTSHQCRCSPPGHPSADVG